MSTLTVSPEAEQDLLEIWFYIAEDSPVNADRFLDKIHVTAQRLSEFNQMGVARDELVNGVFSFPLDRYVLYYNETGTGIELVRVLHSSRDVHYLF